MSAKRLRTGTTGTSRAPWGTVMTGTIQHVVAVIERLHGRALDPYRLEPATRGWAVQSTPVALIDYLEAAERLWAFSRRVIGSWPPDAVLLTPTLTRLPAEIAAIRSQPGVTDDAVRFSALVRIWNVTGQPAITVPLHETSDGIPVGIQLVGPPGRDELVLSLAAQLEQALGRHPNGLSLEPTTYVHTT
jgi:amidase